MNPDDTTQSNPAADLIRQKLNSLYQTEPSAEVEVAEVIAAHQPLSKHQHFIYNLNASGQSPAEVQAAWHAYYAGLDDDEKHEVWREYNASLKPIEPVWRAQNPDNKFVPKNPLKMSIQRPKRQSQHKPKTRLMSPTTRPEHLVRGQHTASQPESLGEIKQQLLGKVAKRQKLTAKHHFQSLIFGLSIGSLVMLILLFSFFNERFIAPFITPSRSVSATPIIIDQTATVLISPDPKVIIPKINVEAPVVYDEPSIDEKPLQKALERGVVHYATTPLPGEPGNVVIFGHSSNNILNQGKFKFAFVLLSRLEVGDTFYLTKDSKQYAYKIFEKKIVKPTAVEVLGPTAKPFSATLITCDPPGSSLNRLIIVGEQISPVTESSSKPPSQPAALPTKLPTILPSNSESLWSRFTHWL